MAHRFLYRVLKNNQDNVIINQNFKKMYQYMWVLTYIDPCRRDIQLNNIIFKNVTLYTENKSHVFSGVSKNILWYLYIKVFV